MFARTKSILTFSRSEPSISCEEKHIVSASAEIDNDLFSEMEAQIFDFWEVETSESKFVSALRLSALFFIPTVGFRIWDFRIPTLKNIFQNIWPERLGVRKKTQGLQHPKKNVDVGNRGRGEMRKKEFNVKFWRNKSN